MAEARPAPSTKPIAAKLLLRPAARAVVVNAPAGYLDVLGIDVNVDEQLGQGPYDFVQAFVTRKDDLLALAPKVRRALAPTGMAWFSYPKARALGTDLNRDIVRLALAPLGLETVSQAAIDDVWSALRTRPV